MRCSSDGDLTAWPPRQPCAGATIMSWWWQPWLAIFSSPPPSKKSKGWPSQKPCFCTTTKIWWHLTLNILELWGLFMALSLLFVGTSSVYLQFLLPSTIFARVQLWPGGTYVGPSWHPLKASCDKIASSVKPALADAGSVLQEVTQNCTVVNFFSGVQVGSVWVWEKKHKALPPRPVLRALWLDLDMCWAILPSWLSALQGKVTKKERKHRIRSGDSYHWMHFGRWEIAARGNKME